MQLETWRKTWAQPATQGPGNPSPVSETVSCKIWWPQTPKATGADNISSPSETVTLTTQVANTSVTSLFTLLPSPYLLLGIPIGLAVVLALLYGLLVWVLQRRPAGAPVDTEAGPGMGPAQGVNLPPHQEPKALQTEESSPNEDHDQHPLQECDGAAEPPSVPCPNFPVPATELGAMVLVTTKTITSEL
ncbi:tumor necrosis factor receptor superfamily member 13C [Sarcophilus harrisii]